MIEDPWSNPQQLVDLEAKRNGVRITIDSEIESVMHIHTWEIVDLPPVAKTIGCKWIFKNKLKPNESIEKYKAHLVAKGFKQNKDVDYFDTFAPMTRISSIKVLIALASVHNLVILCNPEKILIF